MKIDTFACDVCKTQKQETNHWWIVAIWADGAPNENNPMRLELLPWALRESASADHEVEALIDLCGEVCVTKKISEFMGAK